MKAEQSPGWVMFPESRGRAVSEKPGHVSQRTEARSSRPGFDRGRCLRQAARGAGNTTRRQVAFSSVVHEKRLALLLCNHTVIFMRKDMAHDATVSPAKNKTWMISKEDEETR